jgi:ketosteroid isomerase-like protein
MRLITSIAFIALAFAAPVHAQQVDQQTRQQVESIVVQFVDALNKGDDQAIAAQFSPNLIAIGPRSKATTIAQLQAAIKAVHQRGLAITATVDEIEPLFAGQGIVATAPYKGIAFNRPVRAQIEGNFLLVLERIGDSWKIHAAVATRSLPATKGNGVQLAQSSEPNER